MNEYIFFAAAFRYVREHICDSYTHPSMWSEKTDVGVSFRIGVVFIDSDEREVSE